MHVWRKPNRYLPRRRIDKDTRPQPGWPWYHRGDHVRWKVHHHTDSPTGRKPCAQGTCLWPKLKAELTVRLENKLLFVLFWHGGVLILMVYIGSLLQWMASIFSKSGTKLFPVLFPSYCLNSHERFFFFFFFLKLSVKMLKLLNKSSKEQTVFANMHWLFALWLHFQIIFNPLK